MNFYTLYEANRDISPVVRGLARLIESGTWITWYGDGGYWRDLTPPTEEWKTIVPDGPFKGAEIQALPPGRTLRFSREGRDVNWPKSYRYGECHLLNAAEKEHLYAIYERVYLIPDQELTAARRKAEVEEARRLQQAWQQELEQIGSAA